MVSKIRQDRRDKQAGVEPKPDTKPKKIKIKKKGDHNVT